MISKSGWLQQARLKLQCLRDYSRRSAAILRVLVWITICRQAIMGIWAGWRKHVTTHHPDSDVGCGPHSGYFRLWWSGPIRWIIWLQPHLLIHIYARGRDYHDVLKGRLKQLAGRSCLNRLAGQNFVDTAPLMEKPLAAQPGWRRVNILILCPAAMAHVVFRHNSDRWAVAA